MISVEDDMCDHEEEIPRDSEQENWELSDNECKTEEPECDKNLVFVLMLKDNKALFSESQVPSVKAEKVKCVLKVIEMYSEIFGEELSVKQLYEKINNMKTEVRKKFNVDSAGVKKIILCKPWEKLFQELMNDSKTTYRVSNNSSESDMNVTDSEFLGHEEEIERELDQGDNSFDDFSDKSLEPECDKKLEFVYMLKDNRILFSKSQAPAVKEEKRKCVMKIIKMYSEAFGEELTVKQLFKKVSNMKTEVKKKLYTNCTSSSKVMLKPWETLLSKVIHEVSSTPAVIKIPGNKDEEEFPKSLTCENCSVSDLEEDDQEFDKNLVFLLMLKEKKVLFSKSQMPSVKTEKEQCVLEVLKMYSESFGKQLTPKQLFKKISNMKTEVKKKFELCVTGNKRVQLKPWEKYLIEIIYEDTTSHLTSTNTSEATTTGLKRKVNYCQHSREAGIECKPLASNQCPSSIRSPEPITQIVDGPSKQKKSKIDLYETEETRQLSNTELQRIVLLEQLKLVRLKLQREVLSRQTNVNNVVKNEANTAPRVYLCEQ